MLYTYDKKLIKIITVTYFQEKSNVFYENYLHTIDKINIHGFKHMQKILISCFLNKCILNLKTSFIENVIRGNSAFGTLENLE